MEISSLNTQTCQLLIKIQKSFYVVQKDHHFPSAKSGTWGEGKWIIQENSDGSVQTVKYSKQHWTLCSYFGLLKARHFNQA